MAGDGSGGSADGRSTGGRGAFLITVDTEGDNLWSKPRHIAVRNAETLPRFQALCEKYALKPTYLTNWEMVNSSRFVEFGRDVLSRGTAEIGMHLHAWNSPPLVPLTDDDFRYQPYLTEYPEDLIREKVKVMTDTLETTFGVKMVSHRGGRFALNETYARVLVDSGYLVDCSVTPHVDWRTSLGSPAGAGGPDYRDFPETAYFMDEQAVHRPGTSPLLQVPLTSVALYDAAWARSLRAGVRPVPFVRRFVLRALPAYSRLSPKNTRGKDLQRILSVAHRQRRDYVEFMIHSSELMAGGSPWFITQEHIERVYDDIENLFDYSTRSWSGLTLSEYHDAYRSGLELDAGRHPAHGHERSSAHGG